MCLVQELKLTLIPLKQALERNQLSDTTVMELQHSESIDQLESLGEIHHNEVKGISDKSLGILELRKSLGWENG
jgi:hypothetical protein